MTAGEVGLPDSDGPSYEQTWIDAGYWRIEGDLWCCPRCNAATPKPDEHTEWHEWQVMSQGQRVKFMLRKQAEAKRRLTG